MQGQNEMLQIPCVPGTEREKDRRFIFFLSRRECYKQRGMQGSLDVQIKLNYGVFRVFLWKLLALAWTMGNNCHYIRNANYQNN